MRRKITTFIFLCMCTIYSVCSQTFNYQAVVRDAAGDPITNQSIGVLVRIIEGSPSGNVVYNEAHTVTSNPQGVINFLVGGGTSGENFNAIDWSQQNQWIDIQVDVTGGTTYVQLGTSKLQFVPYAIYALNSNNATNAGPFNYTNNVVSNNNGNIFTDDFVFGSSQLDVNGTNSPVFNNRLFFDKSKAAFRAGYTSGDQWDEAKIGDYSVGLGQGGTASGTNSFAMGRNANASGNEAFAFGFNAGGFADYAKGFGLNARAFGVGATAMGTHLQANSYGEVQLGMYSVFTSGDANNWVATDRLFVIGNGQDDINNALDSDALVMLKNGNTTLHGTFTVDADNVGGGAGYTLPGQDGTTNQILSTDGSGNVAWINTSSALPNGGANGDVLQTDGAGNYSWMSNDVLPTGGTDGFVLQTDGTGSYTWVTKDDADADATNEIELPTGGTNGQVLATDGSGVYTWVDQPTVLGAVFSTVGNVTSNAPGDTTTDDFVFGSTQIDDIPGIPDNNRMVFDKSKAGAFRAGSAFNTPYFNQDQLGAGSVGFGVNNQATGIYAATMGNFNDSSGYASFTSGDYNTASGSHSFSAGSNNTSSGNYAFTFGLALTSEALVQTTLGLNNTAVSGTASSFVATDRLLVVGNGVDGANKSDAMVMLKNGNTTLNGELTIDSDNQGSGASYTLPAQDGTANQVMSTNGSGAVSWIDAPSGSGGGTFATTANVTSNANGTVATDDFVFGSTQLANDTGTTNDDNRVFFDKSKAAFRAGSVTGNEWDDANVGLYSIGLGQNAEPRASNAIAIGTSVEALGNGSIGLGNQTASIGDNSIVIGNTSVALSRDQITLGTWNERDLTGNPTSWEATDRLLVVGNGTGSMALSNALVMLKNGNTILNGQLTIDGDNAGAGTSYTLPAQDGTANQVMSTDGSGAVSWIEAPSGGTTLPAGGTNGQVLSTDGSGVYSWVIDAVNDADADATNEIELPVGGTNGQVLVTDGSGVYSWVTDAVNDADADATNEIELPVGGSNGQILATDGSGVYSWIDDATGTSTFSTTANVTSNAPGTIATDDFVFGSTQLADVTGTTNDDSRMFFDKSKSALRAGYAFNDKWDDSNIGVNSIALGLNSGATELNTVAIGNSVNANRLGAVAIGYDSGVAGEYGISLGSGNISFAKNEVVIGSYASFDVSASTDTWVSTERLFVIGNGTSLGSRSSAFVMLKNGNTTLNGSLTIDGDNTGAGPSYTLPAQDGTVNQVMSTDGSGVVSWANAPATGAFSTTSNVTSNTSGTIATDDFVFGSTQLDNDTNTFDDSHRFFFDKSQSAFRAGEAANAQWDASNIGYGSVAFGTNNTASGSNAMALGLGSTASGPASFAHGVTAIASGTLSFAMGANVTASGNESVAFGHLTNASGRYAFAAGNSLTAESYGQTTIGLFNTPQSGNTLSWVGTDRLFVIGNGTDNTSQSDALVISKNGNTTLNGELTIDGDNQGSGTSYTLPAQDGTTNQIMVTDGSGNLSWTNNAAAPGAYTAATLNSAGGWQYYNAAFGVTNFQDPRYRKVDNVVTLEGLCRKNAAISNGDVLMTLPVGFRPLKTRIFSVETENGTARVDVNPNGTVLVATGFNVTQNWVSLDGLTFSID